MQLLCQKLKKIGLALRACHRFLDSFTTRDQQKLRTCLLVNSPVLPGPCLTVLDSAAGLPCAAARVFECPPGAVGYRERSVCAALIVTLRDFAASLPVPRPGFCPPGAGGMLSAPWPLRAAMAPWSPVTVGPPWPFGALCAGQSSVDPILAGVPYGVGCGSAVGPP